MRNVALLILLACACALAGAVAASADEGSTPPSTTPSADATATAPKYTHAVLQRLIDRYRHRTWHWQRVMGRRVTLTLEHSPEEPDVRIATWKRIAARTRHAAHNPPHLSAWTCIQRYEASWHDPNAPYYGGLQMDLGFQRTYGASLLARKGTADHWTPLEQMWVAERAFRAGRGFYPWPNTARFCGLL